MFVHPQSYQACNLFTSYIRLIILLIVDKSYKVKSARLIVKVVEDRKTRINRSKVDNPLKFQSHGADNLVTTELDLESRETCTETVGLIANILGDRTSNVICR